MVAISTSHSLCSWRIVAELPHMGSLKDVRVKVESLQILHELYESSDFAIVFWFSGYRFRLEHVNGHVRVWGNDDNCPVETHLAILRLLLEALKPDAKQR